MNIQRKAEGANSWLEALEVFLMARFVPDWICSAEKPALADTGQTEVDKLFFAAAVYSLWWWKFFVRLYDKGEKQKKLFALLNLCWFAPAEMCFSTPLKNTFYTRASPEFMEFLSSECLNLFLLFDSHSLFYSLSRLQFPRAASIYVGVCGVVFLFASRKIHLDTTPFQLLGGSWPWSMVMVILNSGLGG